MDIYNIKPTDIVHSTSVDLISRVGAAEVYIVQYDNTQPIIAVKLFKDLKRFCLPEGYEANIRWSKPDSTFVYKKVLGCNSDRNIVYFAVDEQMTLIEGKISPIIELTYAGAVVGSSPISVIIDRNPIQIDDIESQAEWPAITERVSNAETQAIAAKNLVEGLDSKIEDETSRATARENELETKIAHANITDVQVNGESVVKDKIAQVDLTEYAKSSDLTSYVLKSGDTMTGTLNVPTINSTNTSTAVSINVGTNASSYFQARKFRGKATRAIIPTPSTSATPATIRSISMSMGACSISGRTGAHPNWRATATWWLRCNRANCWRGATP